MKKAMLLGALTGLALVMAIMFWDRQEATLIFSTYFSAASMLAWASGWNASEQTGYMVFDAAVGVEFAIIGAMVCLLLRVYKQKDGLDTLKIWAVVGLSTFIKMAALRGKPDWLANLLFPAFIGSWINLNLAFELWRGLEINWDLDDAYFFLCALLAMLQFAAFGVILRWVAQKFRSDWKW
jgi:hypothetical protein